MNHNAFVKQILSSNFLFIRGQMSIHGFGKQHEEFSIDITMDNGYISNS